MSPVLNVISNLKLTEYRVFVPPPGFKAVKSLEPVPTALGGKRQAWLIQVPPGFDLSTLKQLPIPTTPFDRKTFSVADEKYAISQSDMQESISSNKEFKSRVKLLAAGSDEGNMKISSKSFTQFFQITPDVSIPNINYDEVVVPKPKVAPIEGLGLRHYSTGYGPTQAEIDAARIARVLAEPDSEPKHKEKKSKKKKHSIEEDLGDGPVEKKRKKEKKDKKDKKHKSKHDN